MFYYYGRKKKLVKVYPSPIYDTIIEPFAGSAAYSLHWAQNRKVILIEKDEQVYELWKSLQSANPNDILEMPDLKRGDKTSNFLHILHSASKRAFDYKTITVTKVLETNWNCNKRKIAEQIPSILDWKIINGDYSIAPDIEATWFIDPPYFGDMGTGYRFGSDQINYSELKDWIMSRKGQVIVCGSASDDWLKFSSLATQSTINGKRNYEGVFIRHLTPREPDSLKAGVLSLPDVVKSESNLPA